VYGNSLSVNVVRTDDLVSTTACEWSMNVSLSRKYNGWSLQVVTKLCTQMSVHEVSKYK
jgi:hypothetical protein